MSLKLFKWKHFEKEIILLCMRWYLKYPLSYRNLVDMMAERGLVLTHTTIMRWVHQYSPIIREAMHMIRKGQVEGIQCVLSEVEILNRVMCDVA